MTRKCAGCGKPNTTSRRYCLVCQEKLQKMQEDGYLQCTHTRTIFSESLGRKLIDLRPAIVEDNYGEESRP